MNDQKLRRCFDDDPDRSCFFIVEVNGSYRTCAGCLQDFNHRETVFQLPGTYWAIHDEKCFKKLMDKRVQHSSAPARTDEPRFKDFKPIWVLIRSQIRRQELMSELAFA